MAILLSLPFTLTSVLLYLSLLLFGNTILAWLLPLVVSFMVNSYLFIRYWKNFWQEFKNVFIEKKQFLSLVLIALTLTAVGVVLSPLILITKEGFVEVLQFPGVSDYYKHAYAITALLSGGASPTHPFFPQAQFIYYYGYYLLPAAVSKVFSYPQTTVLYFYVLTTTTVSLLLIWQLFTYYLKSLKYSLSAFLMIILGTGMDIIPTLIKPPHFSIRHIELWSEISHLGVNVTNTYTAYLWVPQHFLAAVLAIVLIQYFKLGKPNWVLVTVSYIFVCLTSIFVAITLAFWTLLVFILKPTLRTFLIKVGIIVLAATLPFLLSLRGKGEILDFYIPYPPTFFNFDMTSIKWWFSNLLLSFFLDYGLVFFVAALVFWLFYRVKNIFSWFVFLGLALPVFVTWFIRSPYFNDFGMRLVLPIQLVLPVVYFKLINSIVYRKLQFLIYFLIFINVLFSTMGFGYEFFHRLKTRVIIEPNDSQMLLSLRQQPISIKYATLSREEWVFVIPSLGFKPILSPSLFDAEVYLPKGQMTNHINFDHRGYDIFLNNIIEEDLDKVMTKRNQYFDSIYNYFKSYTFDRLIMRKNYGQGQGLNPWTEIFKRMGVKYEALAGDFWLFDYDSLLAKFSEKQLWLDIETGRDIEVKDKKFSLAGGIWFLSSCTTPGQNLVKLDLENYYLVFEGGFDSGRSGCAGALFYLPEDRTLVLAEESQINRVQAFHVFILNKN